MVDGPVDDGPGVPDSVRETGVQRALGERRRRRLAERSGQVDLDATMSHWPVAEPPSAPRPVVRPARPSLTGVATAPVLPTPGAVVVGALLEQRRAGAEVDRRVGGPVDETAGRRFRRRAADVAAAAAAAAAAAPSGVTTPATGPGAVVDPDVGPVAGPGADHPDEPPVQPTPTAEPEPDWEADLVRPAGAESRSRRRPDGSGSTLVPTGPAAPTRTPTPTPTAPRTPHGATVLGGPARSRRRWPSGRNGLLLAAGLLAALLVVVLLVVQLLDGDDEAEAVAPVEGAPAQQTLAVALAGADGGVSAAALIGVDSAAVSTLLLPPELLLTVADAGEVPLQQAATLGVESVQRGLEDTLQVRVDDALVLQPEQLGGLVDGVGGVVVDVVDEVVTDDVVVAAGDDQRLTGAQVVAYAGLQVDGEPTEAALARFGAVLTALLAALPTDEAAAEGVLAEAGVGGDDDTADLAALVAAAADRSGAGNAQSAVLPTRELSAGGAELRGVDDDEARQELTTRFAGALLPVAAVGEVRVVVRNGVGTPGLVGQARDRLVADGLRFAGGGNAPSFGQETSVVLVASQDDEDRDRGEAVAAALGLGADSLQVNSEAMVDTDVVVVLGDDFARIAADDPSASTEPTSGDNP